VAGAAEAVPASGEGGRAGGLSLFMTGSKKGCYHQPRTTPQDQNM